MTFSEMSKEYNLPASRSAEYVYGKFREWYIRRTEECGLTGNPSVFKPTFYWWVNLNMKVAALPFAFVPGDLAVYKGKYVVVDGRYQSTSIHTSCTMFNEATGKFETMQYMDFPSHLQVRDSNGASSCVCYTEIKFADIPQEIFRLACNKANACPMMGGKENA